MKIHFDRQPIGSIDDAYAMYKASEFESPTRSTIPLLSWLKHEQQALVNLLAELEVPKPRSIHLEYKVQCPQGNRPESQTDFMALSNQIAVAFESKWTEPIGDTVTTWLQSRNEQNAQQVLEGWINCLQPIATTRLQREWFYQSIYQMVHRTASACASSETPKVVYLLFHPSFDRQTATQKQVSDELEHLWRLLGRPDTLQMWLAQINLSFTEKYRRIVGLPKESQQTAQSVKEALASTERLFYFDKPVVERIGGTK